MKTKLYLFTIFLFISFSQTYSQYYGQYYVWTAPFWGHTEFISSSGGDKLCLYDQSRRIIYFSVDSGYSWKNVIQHIDLNNGLSMAFVEDSICYLGFKYGRILKANLLDSTMKEIIVLPGDQSSFYQLIMFDAKKGYAYSTDYKLYYTEDGWENHREVALPAPQTEYPHLFSANSSGLIGFFTRTDEKSKFIIFREGDTSVIRGPEGKYTSMDISEEGRITILGGIDSTVDYPGAPTYYYPFVMQSNDMGATWDTNILSMELFGNPPRFIKFNGDTGFIPVSITKLFRTTDGGANWEYLKITPPEQYQLSNIQDLTVINSHRVAFVAESYMIMWDEFNFTSVEDDTEKTTISIYPLPAYDFIRFEGLNEDGAASVDIVDSKGIKIKSLYNLSTENDCLTIPLSGISNGVYLALIRFGDGKIKRLKFVVNK